MKYWIYILTIAATFSCNKSVKKFEVETDYTISVVELFSDSTFVEKVKEDFDEYEYTGTWSGSFENGSEFITKVFKLNDTVMIFKPERTFEVENGSINWVNLYVDGLIKYMGTDSVTIANEIIKREKINNMIAHVVMQNSDNWDKIKFKPKLNN